MRGKKRIMSISLAKEEITRYLDRFSRRAIPGIQYWVVDANRAIFEYAGGWADIRNRKPMKPDTTQMAYSMTKTWTAAAILQLVEREKLNLDDKIDHYLSHNPYNHDITIRHLISHTAGIPNPIPLRWVHLAQEHEHFDENAALAKVLRDNPKLSFQPGKYAYSNLGYWLLGAIIEAVTQQTYTDYMREHVLKPLGLAKRDMDFIIPDVSNHAQGYLRKYSVLNLVKGLVTDRKMWGQYEGNWLKVNRHYVNGPAFGGLVGSAQACSRFLQDQLRESSVLFGRETKQLFYTQQRDRSGEFIQMTPGWHIGALNGLTYFFKEGGGGGFHSEMRIYPTRGIASVIMVNRTQFKSNSFLSGLDKVFLQ
jgi:D-alanyl-D-alanine carboxypeptidase